VEAHRARGLVLSCTGNYAEAIQEYKQALAISDKLWELHYALGAPTVLTAIMISPSNRCWQPLRLTTEPGYTHRPVAHIRTQGQFGKAVQYAEQAVK
jgi:tetratricopeptide (TPR) repeat protein